VIAKIVSGSDFGASLDYLLNPKKEQRERVEKDLRERGQERRLEGEQRQAEAAERTQPTEAKTRDEAGRREGRNPGASEGGGRQEKQPRAEGRGQHFEQERDLPNEFEPGQRHRIIGGNVSGKSPRELEREFGLVKELRPGVEKPVHHVSISAAESDRLTVRQWQEIADTYVEQMGFGNSPHLVVQHRWSKKDHIHILASRVDFDGQVVS
jgi:Relaxase/Mobilisation nuclease domain